MASARREKRRRARVVALIIILIVLAALLWFVGRPLYERYSSNKELLDLPSYLGLKSAGEAAVLIGDAALLQNAFVRDGVIYWNASEVRLNFAENFWYSTAEGILLLTTADEVVRAEAGALAYTRHAEIAPVDGVVPEEVAVSAPVFLIEDGNPYISLDYAQQFSNFSYELFSDPYRIQIYAEDTVYETADVKKKTSLRGLPDIKSGVVRELNDGEKLYIMETDGDWAKVRTTDALTGYVETRRLSESYTSEILAPNDYSPPPYTELTSEEKICLGWHQVSVYDANAYLDDMISGAWPMNVISPTWYSVADGSGAVNSIASAEYVAKAHARGLEVWPLVNDFADGLDRETLLSSTSSRNAFVSYLIGQANSLGFDGINLDFEVVPSAATWGFEQLLRELSVACRAHGLVFSIDNYPPRDHTEHYNRRLQGEIADYVINMGYDEHWGSASGAGSVASLPFVEEAVQLTLDVVPARKVINAVPFYTRIWNTNSEGTVRATAVGQKTQAEWIARRELTPEWNEELGQNYVETTENGILYQIWLEDADSMQARIDMMKEYDIGGVAGWRLGLESDAFWNILGEYARG